MSLCLFNWTHPDGHEIDCSFENIYLETDTEQDRQFIETSGWYSSQTGKICSFSVKISFQQIIWMKGYTKQSTFMFHNANAHRCDRIKWKMDECSAA